MEIYKKRISFFTEGEIHDRVLKELTRRKEHNIEKLRVYGLDVNR